MPKAYPREFREDVVRVARSREEGVTLRQVASDFGIWRDLSDELAGQGRPRRWWEAGAGSAGVGRAA